MMRAQFAVLVSVAVLACSLACQKRGEQPAPPVGTQAPPSAQQPVTVVRIDLGSAVNTDKTIATATETFRPSDTIYASVETAGTSPSANLAIRWTYQDGQVVNESSQTIAPTGPARTEFHIAKPDGWPAGSYTANVILDGAPVATKTFVVQ